MNEEGTAQDFPIAHGNGDADDSVSGLVPRVAAAAEKDRDKQLERLRLISSLDAPSGNAEALEPVADLLGTWLAEIGGATIRHPGSAGPQLEVVFGEAVGPGREAVVLCHYDTVWPLGTVASRPMIVEGDVVRGPGVLDMRGGIVAALGAVEILAEIEAFSRPVRVVLTPDEETGSRTSAELIASRARRAELVLVPEPALPNGALKSSRKGWLSYEIRVSGRAAHAGLEPEAGVSAVDELVDVLIRLRTVADTEIGTTINCGVISGGTAANVIPGSATASVDVRVPDGIEELRIRKAFAGLESRRPGVGVSVELLHSRPPLERTPAVASAVEQAVGLGRLLGLEIGEGSAGGVSDGNLAGAEGAVVLDGLGPVGVGAHAVDECFSLRSLVERTALIAMLLVALPT